MRPITGLMAGIAATATVAAAQLPAATLTVQESEDYGQYLADGEGRALYLFTLDRPSLPGTAEVTCIADACQEAWPLFTAEDGLETGEGVQEELAGTMEADGRQVVTYDGWPLYYYAEDTAGAAPKGQDIHSFAGEWYLLQPNGEKVEG